MPLDPIGEGAAMAPAAQAAPHRSTPRDTERHTERRSSARVRFENGTSMRPSSSAASVNSEGSHRPSRAGSAPRASERKLEDELNLLRYTHPHPQAQTSHTHSRAHPHAPHSEPAQDG